MESHRYAMTNESDDKLSLDIVGAGKIAKAIPKDSWREIVTTACETFRQCVAPITTTTSGIGRLLDAYFDGLVEARKVLAADCIARAQRKADGKVDSDTPRFKTTIVIAALDSSSVENDPTIRELWANLLAQELIDGNVHPEFPRTLSRLSNHDAQTLAHVAEKNSNVPKVLLRVLLAHLTQGSAGVDPRTFSHEHLANLNLIERVEGQWKLTLTGDAFLRAVTDPTVTIEPES